MLKIWIAAELALLCKGIDVTFPVQSESRIWLSSFDRCGLKFIAFSSRIRSHFANLYDV
jgi:hypothetical protein